jgi:hypothetical protein
VQHSAFLYVVFVVCNTEFLKTFYDRKKQVCVLHTECTEQLVEFLHYNLHISSNKIGCSYNLTHLFLILTYLNFTASVKKGMDTCLLLSYFVTACEPASKGYC